MVQWGQDYAPSKKWKNTQDLSIQELLLKLKLIRGTADSAPNFLSGGDLVAISLLLYNNYFLKYNLPYFGRGKTFLFCLKTMI